MKIGRFKVSKHAVSPVIATLLMIAIAVAASIIVYVWSIGLLGGLMGSGGSQVKEQLIMEAYKWNSTTLSVTVRNVGSSSVTIAATYVGGNSATFGGGLAANSPINVGSSAAGDASVTGTAGVSYILKIVTKTGGVFSFSVINGSAG